MFLAIISVEVKNTLILLYGGDEDNLVKNVCNGYHNGCMFSIQVNGFSICITENGYELRFSLIYTTILHMRRISPCQRNTFTFLAKVMLA